MIRLLLVAKLAKVCCKEINISLQNKSNLIVYLKSIVIGGQEMRERVLLICEECLSRNYTTTIKKEGAKNLQIKKFCKRCNKMTLHKISK